MARPRKTIELKDNQIALTGEEMFLIVKALDVYCYALLASNTMDEFHQVQGIAKKMIEASPKMELDS